MRGIVRGGIVAFGVAALAAFSVGGPVVGGGPYSLPQTGSGQDLWNGPSSKRAGVRVSNTSGRVKVEATKAGTTTALGQVDAGRSAVFEGEWDLVKATAMAANTAGTYEVREPTVGYGGNDGTVGAGSYTQPSGAYTPYQTWSSPTYRLLTVKSSPGGTVNVRTAAGGAVLLTVSDGDWSFCGVNSCPRFVTDGSGTVEYSVFDVRAGAGPCEGVASGAAGTTDRAALDGTKALSVTFQNVGSAAVQVTAQAAGQATNNLTLPAGGPPQVVSGMLSVLQWTYVGGAGSVRITVVGG